jgi:hypothetical protein
VTEAKSGAWPTGIGAITLFVEDVPAARSSTSPFGLPVGHVSDDRHDPDMSRFPVGGRQP